MVLAETTGSDTILYLHGLGLVAQSDGTTTEYFGTDGLGSVRQVMDERPVGPDNRHQSGQTLNVQAALWQSNEPGQG